MYRGYFFAEYARKIEENAGKIREFPRNPFLEVAEPKGDPAVVFAVIFGRFRSHFRSFLDMIQILSVFFPFLFLFIPHLQIILLLLHRILFN